jgi:WD40 repeat protein
MCKNKRIKVRVALLLILAIFLSSPFIFLETSLSHDEARAVNERDIRSANSIWSYTTGEILFSVAISSDGQYIAAGGKDNKTYLFSKDSSTPLWNYTTGGWVRTVAISSNGQYITAGSDDGKIYLFDKTLIYIRWRSRPTGSTLPRESTTRSLSSIKPVPHPKRSTLWMVREI